MDGWKNRIVNALYGAQGNSLFDQPMKLGGGLFDMTTADVLNTPIARGSVLPLTEYVNRAEFDTDSGLFGAIKRAATAPGRAYSGQVPESQMLDEGMNFAGMISGGAYGVPRPYGSVGMSGGKYYRNTRTDSPFNAVPWAQFADDPDRVKSYGKNSWTFDDQGSDGTVSFGSIAMDAYRLFRESGYAKDEARNLVAEMNPRDIVDSAGLWDNADLVEMLYQNVLDKKGIRAVTTNNGAIVFDPELIKKAP